MAFLIDAYTEDEAPNTKGGVDKRVVLRLDPRLAPVKVAVLPLSRNADLSPKAKALAAELRGTWNVDFDDSGAIGRRYRRQDEIGTPFCVTVDFETLDDDAVTIRERDSMAQERVALDRSRVLRGAPRGLLRPPAHVVGVATAHDVPLTGCGRATVLATALALSLADAATPARRRTRSAPRPTAAGDPRPPDAGRGCTEPGTRLEHGETATLVGSPPATWTTGRRSS